MNPRRIPTSSQRPGAPAFQRASSPAFRRCLSLIVTCGLLAAPALQAQNTWTGNTSNSWGTSTNWNPNAVPGAAVFTSASNSGYSIVLGGGNRSGSITFDASTAATPYTINLYDGNLTTQRVLTLSGATVEAGDHTIAGAKPGGGVAGDLQTNNNADFNIASGASLTLDVRLRHQATSNNYTKTGGGTLVLSANNGGGTGWQFNSASTGFTVSEGVLRFAELNAFGNSGNKYVVASGAAIELAGGFTQTVNNGTITLNGTGIGGNGALRSISGSNTITGSGTGGIVLASGSSIGVDAGSVLTINPSISGGQPLTKVGGGTLILAGPNTYTGATFVDAGVLQIDGSTSTGVLGLNDNSNTTIASGATLRINRTGTAANAMLYGGSLSGTGTVEIVSGARMDLGVNQTNSGSLSFVVDGTLALRTGGSQQINAVHLGELSGSGNIGRGGNPPAPLDPPYLLTIGGKNTDSTFAGSIGGIAELTIEKVGTGTLTFTGSNNTYTGDTLINGGVLQIGAGGTTGTLATTATPSSPPGRS